MCLSSIPVWLDWIKYIGWFLYANEALIVNQWRGLEFGGCKIPPGSTAPTAITPSTNESSIGSGGPINYDANQGFCFSTGSQIIEFYGFEEVSRILPHAVSYYIYKNKL